MADLNSINVITSLIFYTYGGCRHLKDLNYSGSVGSPKHLQSETPWVPSPREERVGVSSLPLGSAGALGVPTGCKPARGGWLSPTLQG